MQQKRVGDKLYVLSMTPYVITEDTDVSIIYVQQEKLAGYLELNPTLADKISTINYLTFSVRKKDWAADGPGPEPTPKKDPEIGLINDFLGFNQGETGNLSQIVENPNELDYEVGLYRATTGETYDIADNDYFTVDAEGNYTVHNNYDYDLTFTISRAEDDEWIGIDGSAQTVIYPTSEEIIDQTNNAESSFNEQTDELDMYLTADIISQMDQTGMADLAANLVNYRYVLSVDYYRYDGSYFRTVHLTPSYNSDSNVMILYSGDTGEIVFTIFFNDNTVAISQNISWLNLHKPSTSEFYAVDLDGYSEDGSQSLVLAVPELENNIEVWKPAYTHQMEGMKVLMYNEFRGGFKVISYTGNSDPVNESESYDCYVGGGYTYYNDLFETLEISTEADQAQISLPFYQFGMKYVLMKNRDTTGLVLTVDKPQDEQWLGELSIGSDANINVFVQDIPYIWLKAGNNVSLYYDGAYGQSANKATAVSGIQQSDITNALFTMPGNDVEVSVQYMPTYEVDLRAQLSAQAGLEPTDISEVTPTIESYDTATPFGNFEGSINIPYTYVGLYDTGNVDENENPIYDIYSIDARDVVWTCDIPGVTIEYDDDDHNAWMITVASGTTLNGTETVSVSIVDGYEVPNFGYITGTKIYSFNPVLPANP